MPLLHKTKKAICFITCAFILSINLYAEDVGQDEIPNKKITINKLLNILPIKEFSYITIIEYNENVWNLVVYHQESSSLHSNINTLPAKPGQNFYNIPEDIQSDSELISLLNMHNEKVKTDQIIRNDSTDTSLISDTDKISNTDNIRKKENNKISKIERNNNIDSSIISDSSISTLDSTQRTDSEIKEKLYNKMPTRKITPEFLKRFDYIYNPKSKKMLIVSVSTETEAYLPPSILYMKKAVKRIKDKNKDVLLSYILYDHSLNEWVAGGTITDATTGEKAEMKYFISVDGKKILNYGISE